MLIELIPQREILLTLDHFNRTIAGKVYTFKRGIRGHDGLLCDLPDDVAIPLLNMSSPDIARYRKVDFSADEEADDFEGAYDSVDPEESGEE